MYESWADLHGITNYDDIVEDANYETIQLNISLYLNNKNIELLNKEESELIEIINNILKNMLNNIVESTGEVTEYDDENNIVILDFYCKFIESIKSYRMGHENDCEIKYNKPPLEYYNDEFYFDKDEELLKALKDSKFGKYIKSINVEVLN